jgi:hypothetical protein
MTNRVGGRFAQEAAFYISVGGVLIEKSITLEGQAAPDPNPPPAAGGPAEDEGQAAADPSAENETKAQDEIQSPEGKSDPATAEEPPSGDGG